MGGYGSGKVARKGTTANACRLDVFSLARGGHLTGDTVWTWRRGEDEWLAAVVRGEQLSLIYQIRDRGQWHQARQVIPLAWTVPHYGGRRPWLLCGCGRRVAVLWGSAAGFRCRECQGLTYPVQREDRFERAKRRVCRIRARLGDRGSLGDPFPGRPKGMHLGTYRRLIIELDRRQGAAAEAYLDGLRTVLKRARRTTDGR